MLALVLVVERGLGRLDRDLLPLAAATWRQAGAASEREAVRADVLCFGDSLVKVGIVPPLLDREAGARSYNLAVLGGTPMASYVLLGRALAAGARPRAIVVDAKANLLMWNAPRANIREWAEMGRLADVVDIAWSERDPGFVGRYLIQRNLHSVRLRGELRKAVLAAFDGRPSGPEAAQVAVVERQAGANRGGLLPAHRPDKGGPDPYPGGRLSAADAAWCYPETWYPRPSNLRYLDRMLSLASARDIDIYFLLPPLHPGVQSELERRGLDERYLKLARRLSGRYPRLTVVDGRHAQFPHSEFNDSIHLDRSGAASFTRRVARVLRMSSDHPRWISLDGHEGPDDAPGLEDLEQSRVALRELGRARR